MLLMQKGQFRRFQVLSKSEVLETDLRSPLKPAELQVLRSQYDKEGEHVGVQTKFNFAWVRAISCRLYELF